MKHKKFLIVAIMLLIAIPVLALPGNFNLKVNPLPDGTIITQDFTDPVLMVSNVPTNATSLVWYLWSGTTPGTPADAIATQDLLYLETPEGEYFLILETSVINSLPEGDYVWTIFAIDANDGDSTTQMSEGYLTFTVDRPTSPDDGSTLSGPGWTDFVFVDTGADWYQVWVGYGADAATPYGYTGLYTWYQADDASVFGTTGAGICDAGLCTIPAEDTTGIYAGGNEVYEWWLQSYTDPDGLSDWALISTFTLDYPAPSGTLANSDPVDASTVTAIPTAISWDEDPGTLWYNIWLGPDDYSQSLVFEWMFYDDICTGGVCTLDLAANSVTLSDTTSYEMWLQYWGPGGLVDYGSSADLSFTVDTGGATTAPVVAVNNGLVVAPSSVDNIIDNTVLQTTDTDTAAASLVYTVTVVPVNGTLSLNGVALVANDTFTQADIDGSLVTYTETGGATGTDSFQFDVTDGVNAPVTGNTFNITINTAPVLAVNAGLTVAPSSVDTAIDNTVLQTTDADGDTLTYTLTVEPTTGTLSLSGVALVANDTFTQADVDAGNLTYTETGGAATTDTFDFEVTDGVNAPLTGTFTITVQ